MPALQVRDLPDALYGALKESAARNHRSIAQQTTAFIEEGLAQEALRANANTGSSDAGVESIAIPATAREASARSRFVEPFSWVAAYEAESSTATEERGRRRRKAKQMAEQTNASTGQSAEDIAELIRSMREDRAETIVGRAVKVPAKAGNNDVRH